jgi:ketosteroid isomerase-like protein
MEDHTRVLERLYEAFNQRDIAAVLPAFSPDVDWPNALTGERISGRDSLRAYWQEQFKLIRSEVTPVAFEVLDDGRTAVRANQVVHNLDGLIWSDSMVVHIYSFNAAGLITRMDLL